MIRVTDEGMREILRVNARGEAVVVISAGKRPPEMLCCLSSDVLVFIDFTEVATGVPSKDLFIELVRDWAARMVEPLVRGARDLEVVVVRSWGVTFEPVTVADAPISKAGFGRGWREA